MLRQFVLCCVKQGWRSWNCYHHDVDDANMRATIDAITTMRPGADGEMTSLAKLGEQPTAAKHKASCGLLLSLCVSPRVYMRV